MTNEIVVSKDSTYVLLLEIHLRTFQAIANERHILAKDVEAELNAAIEKIAGCLCFKTRLSKFTPTPIRRSWIMRQLFKFSSASEAMVIVSVGFVPDASSRWDDVQPQIIDAIKTVLGWDDVEVVDFDEDVDDEEGS